jgi:hypothetical protein
LTQWIIITPKSERIKKANYYTYHLD